MPEAIRFISLCGMLGYGYSLESLQCGLREPVSFMGADAGSTDPGPYYLGSGTGFVKPIQVRRDLEPALCAAVERHIPLIIGSAGGAGAQPHLDGFIELLLDIAGQRQLHFRLAVIPADLDRDVVLKALCENRIVPCGGAPGLTEQDVASCAHLVAQMGTGPIIRALAAGADVIVAGRACDTAIFAALPIWRGCDPGLALHLAKIAECGALCACPAGANDSLIGLLASDHFIVEPAHPGRHCTPESVAAHSLYEQPDPNCLYEPEGKVDMTGAVFEPLDDRRVKVSGSRLIPAARPSVKLEGASLKGYRAITLAGVRDPLIIENLSAIETGVQKAVTANLAAMADPSSWSLRFLRYGVDGVMGPLEPDGQVKPREVGLVIEALAPTQELADTVLSLARSTALHQHFQGRKTTAGNLAFPFSPSDFRGGPVYEFSVYHLMEVDNSEHLFPVAYQEI